MSDSIKPPIAIAILVAMHAAFSMLTGGMIGWNLAQYYYTRSNASTSLGNVMQQQEVEKSNVNKADR